MRMLVRIFEVTPFTGVNRLPLCLDQHLGGIPPNGGRLNLHSRVDSDCNVAALQARRLHAQQGKLSMLFFVRCVACHQLMRKGFWVKELTFLARH